MKCSRCYDWNYSNVKISLPKDYPSSASTNKSYCVTYESMKKAVVTAHTNLYNVRAKTWNKVSIKAYLTLEGFNRRLADDVIKTTDRNELSKILPPCWGSTLEMSHFPETIMHLRFLCAQTVGFVLKVISTKIKLYSKFHSKDNQLKTI